MNRKTLERILKLLNEDPIRVDYLRGVIETLIETQVASDFLAALTPPSDGTPRGELARTRVQVAIVDNDTAALDAQAKKALEVLKSLEQPNE